MIITQAPNEEILKDVSEHREMLHKQAEEGLEENKDAAEEIQKYHGEDTKDVDEVVDDIKQLKAMHLAESLFETFDFEHELYNAVKKVCLTYPELSLSDLEKAFEFILIHIEEDDDMEILSEDLSATTKWSVYHKDNIPEEGTIFEDEYSAEQFKNKMGDDWEVTQLTEN